MIAAPTVVMLAVDVGKLANAYFIVVAAAVGGFDLIAKAVTVVKVFTSRWVDTITDRGTDVGAGVNISGLEAVMTALDFESSVSLSSEESFVTC